MVPNNNSSNKWKIKDETYSENICKVRIICDKNVV